MVRKKLREVERNLVRAGFQVAPDRGKGSHTWWYFVRDDGEIIWCNIAKPKGDMVLDYAVRQVEDAIRRSREAG